MLISLIGIDLSSQIDKSMEKLLAEGRFKKEEFPIPLDAIELATVASFPSPDMENEGIYLADPRGIAQDDQGQVYIADGTQDEVLIFDRTGRYIKSFGRTGQGPGEFLKPWHVLYWNDQILVSDTGNRRVQFFNRDGRFLDKSFRLPKGYQSLAIDRNGNIFGAPTFEEYPKEKEARLIDVLDQNGRILKSFGKLIETKSKYDYSSISRTRLSIGDHTNVLWVAFEMFATVRRYSTNGDLQMEFDIPNPIMKRKAELNLKWMAMRTASTRVPYAVIQAGIYADAYGLYTFVPTPIIEIVHIGNDGKLKNLYWRERENDSYMLGLLAQKDEGIPSFFLIHRLPRRSVDIFKPKEQKRM